MPFSKRVNVIESESTRVRPDIFDPERAADVYVNPYNLDVYEGQSFSLNVRETMVEGEPPPRIQVIIPPGDESVVTIRGDVVEGEAPQISVFGKNSIELTVKAEN